MRSAVAMVVPLGVLTAFGHLALGLQAAVGAFAVLYFSALPAREQAKAMPFVMLGMVGCASLGVLLAPWHLAFGLGLVVVTLVVCLLAFAYRLGPPGPMFFVLIYGLSGTITAVVDGVRRTDPWLYLAVFVASTLFGYLVVLAPLIVPSVRRKVARPLNEVLPGPWLSGDDRLLLARIAVVAVVGTAVSVLWLDSGHAYWTVASGVAVIGLYAATSISVTRGLHRVVGTIGGALAFLAIAPLAAHPWILVVVLGVLQFMIEFVVVRNYALALLFITPLVLSINAAVLGAGAVGTVAVERVFDTALGSALALLAVLVIRRRSRPGSGSAVGPGSGVGSGSGASAS